MGREIKFRIWDCAGKKYYSSPNKQFLMSLDGEFYDGCGCIYDENFIIQQYTGLKDSDGREIYEGDIIQFSHKNNEIEVGMCLDYSGESEVIFDNGCYSVEYRNQWKSYKFNIYNCYNLEVIGNIFEK